MLSALILLSCGKEKLIESACREDAQCEAGSLCEGYRCVLAETKSCEVVIDGNPILQPSPHAASFGNLDAPEATQMVQLHNLGTCTLTIFEASLAKQNKETPFACDLCTGGFPIEIFPGRTHDVQLSFKANAVGAFDDELIILSDDKEFPELRVPIHANFLGVPQLKVAPNPVDFAYVAQGRLAKKTVQITNQGTGVARLKIQSVALNPPDTQDFEIVGPPELPRELEPIKNNSKEIIAFELDYHPRSVAKHAVELVVTTSKGETKIPVLGNAETPPIFGSNPASIDLGPIPLGQTNSKPLTITNSGGAPLTVKLTWGGPNPSNDLYTVPQVVPAIAAGQYLEVQVAATPTAVGNLQGLLLISTNDPEHPSATIPVTAQGVPSAGAQVVKVEMTFENGSDTAFDNDIRNVDLTLEHPYGYVCNKQYPKPTNWGTYGNPFWLAFAPKEEPERIILADSQSDGTYRVMINYLEDCSSLPTELLAGLLGISVDVLLDYLTGGLTGGLNAGDVAKLIEKVCLSHSKANATIRVTVNGTIIAEKTTFLNKKGDSTYALDLVRANGTFTAK